MRLSTGRWVSGDDFFDRKSELRVLKARVRDGNHVLLTGQRRMGKTSIARELGRRLEAEGWILLFTDVEGATCPEDAIADIARAVHPVRAISSRFATAMKRWVTEGLEESRIQGARHRDSPSRPILLRTPQGFRHNPWTGMSDRGGRQRSLSRRPPRPFRTERSRALRDTSQGRAGRHELLHRHGDSRRGVDAADVFARCSETTRAQICRIGR